MASDGAADEHDVMEIGAEEYDLEDDEDVSGACDVVTGPGLQGCTGPHMLHLTCMTSWRPGGWSMTWGVTRMSEASHVVLPSAMTGGQNPSSIASIRYTS